MGTPISGRNAYAYIGGNAVVNLRSWDLTLSASPIDIPPDIGTSGWTTAAEGFKSWSGRVEFNFTTDDFNDIFDATSGTASVALYLYTATGSSKVYLYGTAWLTDLVHTEPVDGVVSGSVGFRGTGQLARQATAA